MQNRNIASLVIGLILFALLVSSVYWTKTSRNEQGLKPTVLDPAVVENVANGSIVLPEAITQFAADGPDGLVSVELDNGVGQLPVGEYRVGAWQVERKDDQNNTWTLIGRHYGTEGAFEVAEGGRTILDVGEPFIAVVHGNRIGPNYYSFGQLLQGRLDEQIILARNGARPGAPKLRIKNNDGSYDRTFAFQYG